MSLSFKIEGLDEIGKDIPNMNKKELTFLHEYIGILRTKAIGGFNKPISEEEEKGIMDKARVLLIAISDRLNEIEKNPGLSREIERRKAKRKREEAKKRKEYRKKLNPFIILIMNKIRNDKESKKLILENIKVDIEKKLIEFPEEDHNIIRGILHDVLEKELDEVLERLGINMDRAS